MKLMDALSARRAVRDFRPDPVDKDVLTELCQAATLAPSYMNLQPWQFAVVADPATVAELGRKAKRHLLPQLDRSPLFAQQRAEISAPSFEIFYNAPALIVICAGDDNPLNAIGCAMAAHSLMLAAQTMGLGSCFVSHALPWLESREGREALGLSAGQHPIAPIIIGCPAAEPLSPGRFAPRIHWVTHG